MGYDYRAYAVIGVKVNQSQLFTKKKVKAFKHEFAEDMNFDPKTGKKLWTTEESPIEGFDGDENFRGYQVYHGSSEGDDLYIALTGAESGSSNGGDEDGKESLSLDSLNTTFAPFRAVLESAGLWSEKDFGLWAVLSGG